MRIYLACPYTHPDAECRVFRVRTADRIASRILSAGHTTFSPISHGHALYLAAEPPLPTDAAWWWPHNREFLTWSEAVVVACLPGWQDSAGVAQELAEAKHLGRPIRYLVDPTRMGDLLAELAHLDAKHLQRPLSAETVQHVNANISDWHTGYVRSEDC